MRTATLLVLVSSLIATPALADTADPAAAHLKGLALDCIHARAAEVERVEPMLTDATSFILDDLCHDQIVAYDRYVRNKQLLERMRSPDSAALFGVDEGGSSKGAQQRAQRLAEQSRAQWQSASVDPSTGELHAPPGNPMAIEYNIYPEAARNGAAAEPFRSAAAEAVLAARTARLAK